MPPNPIELRIRVKNDATREMDDIVRQVRNIGSTVIGGIVIDKFLVGLNNAITSSGMLAGELTKVKNATNIPVEDVQALGYVAKQTGTDIEQLWTGLTKLQTRAFGAARNKPVDREIFDRLKISATDSAGAVRPTVDILLDLADAVQKSGSAAGVTTDALDLLGKKGGKELLSMLTLGRQGITDLMTEMKGMGVLTAAQVKTLHDYESQTARLKLQVETFKAEIVSGLVPALAALQDYLQSVMKVGKDWADQLKSDPETMQAWADGLQKCALMVINLGLAMAQIPDVAGWGLLSVVEQADKLLSANLRGMQINSPIPQVRTWAKAKADELDAEIARAGKDKNSQVARVASLEALRARIDALPPIKIKPVTGGTKPPTGPGAPEEEIETAGELKKFDEMRYETIKALQGEQASKLAKLKDEYETELKIAGTNKEKLATVKEWYSVQQRVIAGDLNEERKKILAEMHLDIIKQTKGEYAAASAKLDDEISKRQKLLTTSKEDLATLKQWAAVQKDIALESRRKLAESIQVDIIRATRGPRAADLLKEDQDYQRAMRENAGDPDMQRKLTMQHQIHVRTIGGDLNEEAKNQFRQIQIDMTKLQKGELAAKLMQLDDEYAKNMKLFAGDQKRLDLAKEYYELEKKTAATMNNDLLGGIMKQIIGVERLPAMMDILQGRYADTMAGVTADMKRSRPTLPGMFPGSMVPSMAGFPSMRMTHQMNQYQIFIQANTKEEALGKLQRVLERDGL